ncbi:hypothetical protein [Erysipelothrix tonsillarum]|uniref:hypothetical protein n=1 Tax=Erysipelothrix tonsillarum TaxID=38402 RepID=UPI001FCCA630|nr:hypothetical protein [Erysipelothrix tonsillarum]
MMDALIQNLREVSILIAPIVGVICLIILAMILYRIYVVVRDLPKTIDRVNGVIDSTQSSVDQLQAPLNTLNNVTNTVDLVNQSAVNAVSSVASYGAKHSDAIVSWTKDFMDKRRNGRNPEEKDGNETVDNSEKEEDFGIYE